MSATVALRVGRSSRRWIGMIGNSWLIAQMSGSDWKIDRLQKYVSVVFDSRSSSSSGIVGMSLALSRTLAQVAQNIRSASARCSRLR